MIVRVLIVVNFRQWKFLCLRVLSMKITKISTPQNLFTIRYIFTCTCISCVVAWVAVVLDLVVFVELVSVIVKWGDDPQAGTALFTTLGTV